MDKLKVTLARFETRERQIKKLTSARKKDFDRLYPKLRALILGEIYKQANGVFPHYFDPVLLRRSMKCDGHVINTDLFLEVIERLGLSDKIEVREGSFGNKHHYCLGMLLLP